MRHPSPILFKWGEFMDRREGRSVTKASKFFSFSILRYAIAMLQTSTDFDLVLELFQIWHSTGKLDGVGLMFYGNLCQSYGRSGFFCSSKTWLKPRFLTHSGKLFRLNIHFALTQVIWNTRSNSSQKFSHYIHPCWTILTFQKIRHSVHVWTLCEDSRMLHIMINSLSSFHSF